MTTTQLRAARARLGLTQQRLAEALEVHRVTVAKWETGAEAIPRLVALALEALTRRVRPSGGQRRPTKQRLTTM